MPPVGEALSGNLDGRIRKGKDAMKHGILMTVVVLLSGSVASGWNDYDPNDFGMEIVSYVKGTGHTVDYLNFEPFDKPEMALGPPTAMTTGDEDNIPEATAVPVVPVYPPFRAHWADPSDPNNPYPPFPYTHGELVTVGNGGEIVIKFSHAVEDDENNLYGIDLIVFGNAGQTTQTAAFWTNGNPETFIVAGGVIREPAIVSVSQDGLTWYEYSSGPYADDFGPTAGFQWDDANDVWGEQLNPTRPLDPNATAADFAGMSVAEMIDAYDGSAGGTGFDIAEFGLDWIQYVRISDDPNRTNTSEVDAVADVSSCGDYRHPYPQGDVNKDCSVDEIDVMVIAGTWLVNGDCGQGGTAPAGDADGNCRVDLGDFELLVANWLVSTWQWE